ncbi:MULTISPECIES: hypothetical protein [unclassified Arthrobacter]|nr:MULTISPECIES: hypothetical protein [unclassified Arthrobacter]MCC3275312.1 hypothetical protein [Arthrobacter sp. zg-Y20]MCC9176760.1 hypothetical protein [Arthrobacter sp. zg-Y750]MDK1315470.1 hypothetical protein [Arthrobacter sp. zg.Y20]WIB05887.1 hypothetical protein QNO06_15425 [Arthrobacter sp. zg-Y20]
MTRHRVTEAEVQDGTGLRGVELAAPAYPKASSPPSPPARFAASEKVQS